MQICRSNTCNSSCCVVLAMYVVCLSTYYSHHGNMLVEIVHGLYHLSMDQSILTAASKSTCKEENQIDCV